MDNSVNSLKNELIDACYALERNRICSIGNLSFSALSQSGDKIIHKPFGSLNDSPSADSLTVLDFPIDNAVVPSVHSVIFENFTECRAVCSFTSEYVGLFAGSHKDIPHQVLHDKTTSSPVQYFPLNVQSDRTECANELSEYLDSTTLLATPSAILYRDGAIAFGRNPLEAAENAIFTEYIAKLSFHKYYIN